MWKAVEVRAKTGPTFLFDREARQSRLYYGRQDDLG